MNHVIIDAEKCKECGYCINFCPKKVVLAKGTEINKRGYYAATVVSIKDCIACGTCAKMCPEAAIEVIKDYKEQED